MAKLKTRAQARKHLLAVCLRAMKPYVVKEGEAPLVPGPVHLGFLDALLALVAISPFEPESMFAETLAHIRLSHPELFVTVLDYDAARFEAVKRGSVKAKAKPKLGKVIPFKRSTEEEV